MVSKVKQNREKETDQKREREKALEAKHSQSHLFIPQHSQNPKPTNNHRSIYKTSHNLTEPKTSCDTHKLGLLFKPCFSLQWIFDCGATDTMTFDPRDLLSTNPKTRTYIQTANGECVSVDQSRPVTISLSLKINNCLLIPNLSHKLLSISQLTRKLNCIVLMSSSGCVVQDAQTGRIIGRGTERDGLYYVDEAIQTGHTLLAHGFSDHQLWTWHRRLGHPSLGYLKRLFPSLTKSNVVLDYEACVLAKSHKHSYSPSFNHCSEPFF